MSEASGNPKRASAGATGTPVDGGTLGGDVTAAAVSAVSAVAAVSAGDVAGTAPTLDVEAIAADDGGAPTTAPSEPAQDADASAAMLQSDTRPSRRSTAARSSTFVDSCDMSPIVDIHQMYTYADIMIVRSARDLAAAIRDARLRQGWTQAQLADRIGASRQWVIALERGKPSAELGTALRAISALGLVADLVPAPTQRPAVDLDRLLGDES